MGSFDFKMLLKLVVFLFLTLKVLAWDGKCPDHVETMPDFNPELYLGDWYNTFASYNGGLDETVSCVKIEINPTLNVPELLKASEQRSPLHSTNLFTTSESPKYSNSKSPNLLL